VSDDPLAVIRRKSRHKSSLAHNTSYEDHSVSYLLVEKYFDDEFASEVFVICTHRRHSSSLYTWLSSRTNCRPPCMVFGCIICFWVVRPVSLQMLSTAEFPRVC